MKRFLSMLLVMALLLSAVPGLSLRTLAQSRGDKKNGSLYPWEDPTVAVPIPEEGNATIQLSTPGEVVYFSFVPAYNEEYGLRSLSGGYPSGRLYDGQGNFLVKSKDVPFEDNFYISYNMVRGETYYLEVEPPASDYTGEIKISAHGFHDLNSKILMEATCYQTGVLSWDCKCGYSYTETIPYAHEYHDAVCILCGADEIYTGPWGDVNWTLYMKTGTLVVSGSGSMATENPENSNEWRYHREDVRTIIIEAGVTDIEYGAFSGLNNLDNVSIGDTVVSIGEYAFSYCSQLSSITIPHSVTTIGAEAFSRCNKLSDITFGNGLTYIGDYAFSGCGGLQEITIPQSVTDLGQNVFSSCDNLGAIWVEEGNSAFSHDENGVLYNVDKTVLVRYPEGLGVTAYVIPQSVVIIGDHAFYCCYGLTEVTIPEGVTTVGDYAFCYCENLCVADIPNSVITIGDSSFYGTGLKTVNLTGQVSRIEDHAFLRCKSLTDVTIGSNVSYLGDYAFEYCSGLKTVTIEEGLSNIGNSAFSDCTALKQVILPQSLTSIGRWAFYGCESLERVSLPQNLSFIDERAFGRCDALVEFIVDENNEFYSDDGCILFDKDKTVLIQCPQMFSGSYTVPDTVETISEYAFDCCSGLTEIIFGKGLKDIGDDAFNMCSGLTAVTIPGNVDRVGRFAFNYCDTLETVVIEEGVEFIGEYAFRFCESLTGVLIEDSSVYLDVWSFDGCVKLLHVHFMEKIPFVDPVMFPNCGSQLQFCGPEWDGTWGEPAILAEPTCAGSGRARSTCIDCGITKIYTLEPTGEHVYETDICTLCGKKDMEAVEEPALKINHSLNLASDISVNYLVAKGLLSGYDMDTVYMEATVDVYTGNEKTGTKTFRLYPYDNGKYYYFTLSGLTAVNMNDSISAVVYGIKGEQLYKSPVDTYTLASYAYSQLSRPTIPDTLKTLCADFLRYGAKTQIYKSYRTDALADSSMTEVHKAYLSDIEAVVFGNTDRVLDDAEATSWYSWVGKSLSLESKVCVKFIFTRDDPYISVADLELRVRYTDINGAEQQLTLKNVEMYNEKLDYFAFTLDSLAAAELRSVVSVQLYRENDWPVSNTMEFSADTYGNNKTGALGDLCKALFAYSDSAKVYFAN